MGDSLGMQGGAETVRAMMRVTVMGMQGRRVAAGVVVMQAETMARTKVETMEVEAAGAVTMGRRTGGMAVTEGGHRRIGGEKGQVENKMVTVQHSGAAAVQGRRDNMGVGQGSC